MDKKLGTVYLFILKLCKGGYIPFFITERKRSERALVVLIQEAFISRVSTQRIERLARALGTEKISASRVSEINKGHTKQAEDFRTLPLEAEYPFLWIDALYENVRDEGQAISIALMIAYGINREGKRDIQAIELLYEESEETWRAFLRKLSRGAKGLPLHIRCS